MTLRGDNWGGESGRDQTGGMLLHGEPKGRLVHFPGISHDAIAQESKRYWQNLEGNVPGAQVSSLVSFLHLASFLERPRGY